MNELIKDIRMFFNLNPDDESITLSDLYQIIHMKENLSRVLFYERFSRRIFAELIKLKKKDGVG